MDHRTPPPLTTQARGLLASMLLGIADVAGKYYLSSALGGFVIYVVLIVVLVLRPNGLFARAR